MASGSAFVVPVAAATSNAVLIAPSQSSACQSRPALKKPARARSFAASLSQHAVRVEVARSSSPSASPLAAQASAKIKTDSYDLKMKELGKSGIKVTDICLGTMTWGRQNTLEEAHEQLDYAWASGINFLDAAEMYPVPVGEGERWGKTEEIIGHWLRKQKRENVIVATKIASRPRRALNKQQINEAVDASLKRLQTDYIDLYQLHWPERYVPIFGGVEYVKEMADKRKEDTVPIEEQLLALDELVRAGKIRAVGLSNETPYGVTKFAEAARQLSLAPGSHVVSIQNAYSLLNRVFDGHLAEACYHEDVGLLAYSPLGFGALTGKYLGGKEPEGARLTLFKDFGARYCRDPRIERAIKAYLDVAKKHGVSPAVMALQFCISRWFCTSTIIGATRMDQLKENLSAANYAFSEELMKDIQEVYKEFPNPAP
eukprot:tig00021494_g21919.t1